MFPSVTVNVRRSAFGRNLNVTWPSGLAISSDGIVHALRPACRWLLLRGRSGLRPQHVRARDDQ